MSGEQDKIDGQVIALAGMLQCAHLVHQIATTGQCASESYNTALQSLFQFDAERAADVYGGLHGVQLGLSLLAEALEGRQNTQQRVDLRYCLGMLHLQKKLLAAPELLEIMRNRLDHAQFKADHFTDDINDLSATVAAIYKDTISTFRFRIHVNGSAQQLQNEANANRIRSLLLAGIRAAVMWRQMGGRRWQLLLSRKRLSHSCQALLKT